MQIILLHPRFQAKSLILTGRHMLLLGLALMVAVVGMATLLYYITIHHPLGSKLSFVREARASNSLSDAAGQDRYIKENLAAMAIKLGEMQAQLMRLDALGERVQGLAGVTVGVTWLGISGGAAVDLDHPAEHEAVQRARPGRRGVAETPGDAFDRAQTRADDRDVARRHLSGDQRRDGLLGLLVRRERGDLLADLVSTGTRALREHAHFTILSRAPGAFRGVAHEARTTLDR